jgi:Na+/proline symporter
MFLVVNVLQVFAFDAWGIPFIVTTSIFILLILLYTFKGGIKTIIWTDTVQTTFMLLALVVSIYLIMKNMNLDFRDMVKTVASSEYSRMIFQDWHDRRNFIKHFLSGIFIAIAMTGLDQEMMQKNLSCRSLNEAQKNMFSFSFSVVFINLIFLTLGASLYLFATYKGISLPVRSDDLFPSIAINHLGPLAGLVFIIGLISAAYPSADGALTSLTTSFSIDFLGLPHKQKLTEKQKEKVRYVVHFCFAILLLLVIVVFRAINDRAVIDKLFTIAGYTYGPLLGLFAFGLFTRYPVRDRWVPWIALTSPVICYVLSTHSAAWFSGYKFGFELLILNGLITFGGLFLVNKGKKTTEQA